jgi:hypothetical protein
MLQKVFPAHVLEITDESERRKAETRFILKLAALYYSPRGGVAPLAESCGYHDKAFSSLENITAELAVKLERHLGRELFPREFFRPDLFLIQE